MSPRYLTERCGSGGGLASFFTKERRVMQPLLLVDLENLTAELVDYHRDPARAWGRALVASWLNENVNPRVSPLSRDNDLIFAVGPFAGHTLSSAQRLSVGAKSPLTGGIKEANAGGTFARALANVGLRGIVIRGKVKGTDPYVLRIGHGWELVPAPELRGLGTYETARRIRERLGESHSICCIGPAGEMGLVGAGIAVADEEGMTGRFAARGGLGSVMGWKGLKAIAVKYTGSAPKPAEPAGFKSRALRWHRLLRNNRATGVVFPKYGTLSMLETVHALGGLPTRCFSTGRFDEVDRIMPQAFFDLVEDRGGVGKNTHACIRGCLIRCSNVFADEDGRYVVSPLEYETVAMMGANLGISSLDAIAKFNLIANDLGLDTIDLGCALGLAMEAQILPFGDEEGVLQILSGVVKGDPLGRLVASGAALTGKVLGSRRIPAVKGQGIPAYDPRAIKGMGVTYATSPMGADHTAGHTVRSPVDHHRPEGQVEVSMKAQILQATMDALGICSFARPVFSEQMELMKQLWEDVWGGDLESLDLMEIGRRVLSLEENFNDGAGIARVERLPDFMYEEPLPPFNLVFDVELSVRVGR